MMDGRLSAVFAKLFDTDNHGQILVKQDTHHENFNPEVRFFFKPDGLGVCTMAIEFEDSDKGWDDCDAAFLRFQDEKEAVAMVASIKKQIEMGAV